MYLVIVTEKNVQEKLDDRQDAINCAKALANHFPGYVAHVTKNGKVVFSVLKKLGKDLEILEP